jgi:putative heme iron utilization protein
MDAITDYERSSGMSHAAIVAARDNVLAQKTLTVAVLDGTAVPDIGVSPFIRRDDGLYIYTSHLAGHVQAVLAQKQACFMISVDESLTQNIWARHRLKFSAAVTEIPRDAGDFHQLCDAFLAAHGNVMGLIREFSDFHMLRIVPDKGVLVLGFAKAFCVENVRFDIVAHLSSA